MPIILFKSKRTRILALGMLLSLVGIAIRGRWPDPPVTEAPPPPKAKRSLKIGLVNMGLVYREYHKTKEHEAEMKEEKSQAKRGEDELLGIWNQWRDDFQVLKNLDQTSEQETIALNESKDVITTYASDRQAEITKHLATMRAEILADLHSLVKTVGAQAGYDLVFDSSGKSQIGIDFLLFSRTGGDLTDVVLAKANP